MDKTLDILDALDEYANGKVVTVLIRDTQEIVHGDNAAAELAITLAGEPTISRFAVSMYPVKTIFHEV